MNVKLLKQVRDYIAKYPEKYDQSTFCGSACCIAGTAAFLSGRVTRKQLAEDKTDGKRVELLGKDSLRLTDGQAIRLFSPSWMMAPKNLRINYFGDSREVQADKAVRRINHFIKTKGAE